MPRLVLLNGPETGKAFELTSPETIIGRQAGAHLRLEGPKVSRRHARVFRHGQGFRVEDLGSSNGTFLNGAKLQAPVELNALDEIGIGSCFLRYEGAEAALEVTIRARTAASTANAELYRGNAAHKLEVILRLSTDLGRTLEVPQLLAQVLDHLFVLFPQAERGLVILLEEGRPVIRAQKQRAGLAQSPRFSASVAHRVASEGVGVFAEDLQTDCRFADAQSIISLGVHAFICVPLPSKGGKPLGVLQLERRGHGHQFATEDLNLLTAIGLQVAVALENAQLHQELLSRQRIEQEVAVAREIQLSYLPSQVPDLPGKHFELHAELVPALEISGDFYDYFNLGSHRLALAVADVCGKGVPAALFMSMVRALLRDFSERQEDPGIILRDLNNAVARQNPKCQFVTVSLCVYDPLSHAIELASAGHPLPLIRRQNGVVETLAAPQGPLLGFSQRPDGYPRISCQLRSGDLLLLYTDGVTEAATSDNRMFGLERLCAALAETPFPSELAQWSQSLRQAIESFTGTRRQDDDMTLALLRVR